MAKVLIATVYGPDPVLTATNKLGPDRLILLVDQEPSKEQEKSIDLIKNSLGFVSINEFEKKKIENFKFGKIENQERRNT